MRTCWGALPGTASWLVPRQQDPLHILVLWVRTHQAFLAEVEYHSWKIAAPTHFLLAITLSTLENTPFEIGLVTQAAVLKGTLGMDSGHPGPNKAGDQVGKEPQFHGAD